MNKEESALTYPWDTHLPDTGQATEIAPGVLWIRMGLPFALDHINLWLLRDRFEGPKGWQEGWTVIDCGIDQPATRAAWEQLFSTVMQGLPIVRVVATHMHPDHLGLAHWLCQRFDAPLWISATDYYAAIANCKLSHVMRVENAADFYASHGADDAQFLDHVRGRTAYYPLMVPDVPIHFNRMQDGDVLEIGGQSWQAISGYGHAPEHISLFCEERGLLISGDMILPRISTNVSVFSTEPEGNPLAGFLHSIDRFSPLPPLTLVLPSHGRPFQGLHTRIAQLHQHHAQQLDHVRTACTKQACSALDIVPLLFQRALDDHQMTFALGEALAHLHYLWRQKLLQRATSTEGVIRFSLASNDLRTQLI